MDIFMNKANCGHIRHLVEIRCLHKDNSMTYYKTSQADSPGKCVSHKYTLKHILGSNIYCCRKSETFHFKKCKSVILVNKVLNAEALSCTCSLILYFKITIYERQNMWAQ